MSLPSFRYHRDPIASGSVIESDVECRCCRQRRGFVYTGPVYAEDDLDDAICPWCIADGSVHRKFDACFVDSEALEGEFPSDVVDEITLRTPSFNSYQSEKWLACCGEPATFLGAAGIAEIRAHYRELEGEAMSHIVYELGISGGAARRMLESLKRDSSPTAFVFGCLRCERRMLYIDQV